ncbi:MAG TPA: ribonuclease HII [Parvularculaceae bacterium]|nr:ribonuclease HII [Parvularculaceae bacterium]
MVETPTFEFEDMFDGLIAGVDEVGRAPLAGPVVAAAVILDRQCMPAGIRDSKTVTEKRRKEIAAALWKTARVGVGLASVEEIDAVNIAQASLLAMTRAVASLPVAPTLCLIDGNVKPKLRCRAYAIVKGDAKSYSIAAASIVAKVARDRMMCELAREFPHYGWEQNKGYAVPAHRAALAMHGPTPHHRRSFAPVHNMLEDEAGQLALAH